MNISIFDVYASNNKNTSVYSMYIYPYEYELYVLVVLYEKSNNTPIKIDGLYNP